MCVAVYWKIGQSQWRERERERVAEGDEEGVWTQRKGVTREKTVQFGDTHFVLIGW